MTQADSRIMHGQRGVSWTVSPFYGPVELDFLVTSEAHSCPYRPGMDAVEQVFAAEAFPPELYHDFMDIGFRRSGNYFYRPMCSSCLECRSIRVVLKEFRLSKSLRRILRKNLDVTVSIDAPRFSRNKYRLYQYYLHSRHAATGADSFTSVRKSLYASPVHTVEFEYRLGLRLIGAGLVDVCSRSLSSVYMFFDPDLANRSLGTFAAIQEILFALQLNIPFYYLGFFVADCKAMNYKARFKPHEYLDQTFVWRGSAEETW
ncbi:arginyltransferase [Desulfomonile tiedjei]|uniref:arginyltransferase n=1 Tax=Desulfomonile tiedjei TaxID=2358 RepID=UPI00031DD94A|nr:arginyltransferase [Desulfomonile tiedjei]